MVSGYVFLAVGLEFVGFNIWNAIKQFRVWLGRRAWNF